MRAAVLLVLALALAPTLARADDNLAEARRHFEVSLGLFSEGNHEGALAELRASYALRPSIVVLYNMAQTLKVLARYEEAIATYRRYLEEGGANIPSDRRHDVEVTIERLRAATGYVVVDCAPNGAAVTVDGRGVGETPLGGPISVAAGRRVVEVTHAGRLPARREVEIVGGGVQRLCLRLRSEVGAGVLRVTSPQAEASVAIDGERAGRPPVELRVSGGGHRVEVAADGYLTFSTELTIASGQRRVLRVTLERESVLSKWWFWTLTGVVLAGGITTAIVLSQPEEAPALTGNVWPGSVTAAW